MGPSPRLPVISAVTLKIEEASSNAHSQPQGDRMRNSPENEGFGDIGDIDAAEYLRRVARESSRYPIEWDCHSANIVGQKKHSADSYILQQQHTERCLERKANTPSIGSAASMQYLSSHHAAVLPPPSCHHLPGGSASSTAAKDIQDWVNVTMDNFVRLRAYLDQGHDIGIGGKDTARRPLPPMKDRSSWLIFCVGNQEAQGNINSYYDDDFEPNSKCPSSDKDSDIEDSDDNGEGVDDRVDKEEDAFERSDRESGKATESNDASPGNDLWRTDLPPAGFPPTTTLLLQMDQVMIRRVLSHLTYYVCEGWSVTESCAQWLYGLLARLERPVHRDDAVVLYALLKRLTLLRKQWQHPTGDRALLARFNVLIVIVGIYFEQGGGYSNVMQVPE
jgi:gem associated protein 2